MSSVVTNPLSPTDRMLRQFGGLWVVFFGVIAARQELHHSRHVLAIVLAALAVTVGPLGLVRPRLIRPIFIGWMALAYPMGWVVSRIVLATIFYGMFTPLAWVFRMTGRDALALKRQSKAMTYWHPTQDSTDRAQYLRQF